MRVGVGFFVDGLVVVEAMVDMVLLAVLVGLRGLVRRMILLALKLVRFGRGPLGSYAVRSVARRFLIILLVHTWLEVFADIILILKGITNNYSIR